MKTILYIPALLIIYLSSCKNNEFLSKKYAHFKTSQTENVMAHPKISTMSKITKSVIPNKPVEEQDLFVQENREAEIVSIKQVSFKTTPFAQVEKRESKEKVNKSSLKPAQKSQKISSETKKALSPENPDGSMLAVFIFTSGLLGVLCLILCLATISGIFLPIFFGLLSLGLSVVTFISSLIYLTVGYRSHSTLASIGGGIGMLPLFLLGALLLCAFL